MIPALRNLRQGDQEFKVSLGYRGSPGKPGLQWVTEGARSNLGYRGSQGQPGLQRKSRAACSSGCGAVFMKDLWGQAGPNSN